MGASSPTAMARARAAVVNAGRWLGNARSLWLAAAALALVWLAFEIAEEIFWDSLQEREVVRATETEILRAAFRARHPELTALALNITALGSAVVLGIITGISGLLLALRRDPRGFVFLGLVAGGAAALTEIMKDVFDRPRPDVIEPLGEAVGHAFPSGHSLGAAAVYTALAVLIARHLPGPWARSAIYLAMAALAVTIGVSRVYLGVHWPTDVASGLALGSAWTLLVAALIRSLTGWRYEGDR